MAIRRGATAVLAAGILVSGALAGCAGAGAAPRARFVSPTPPDARQALIDSTRALAEGSFTFTLADGESRGSGRVHAPSRSAEMTLVLSDATSTLNLGLRIVDPDVWVRLDVGDAAVAQALSTPDAWLHVDPSKVTDAAALEDISIDFADAASIDVGGVGEIFAALVTATSAGDGLYTGTVDLTRAEDVGLADAERIAALGEQATSVPFTAALDAQGRISRLTLDLPAAGDQPAGQTEIAYADYGAATAVARPEAGQAQEAPDAVYQILAS